ncbi:hypothetical protein D0962_07130 [Leptolyngbyaceae cyanobacterium CCMR0082]|uniref:Uncharacterized protein n=2 Tax=Adonisia turfae TaxID=2950184 RepID=A0A6M0S273_9CYAN|nr:hypothetical protein [Adonisia turfae]MDV3349604.1 hypothetical protein [Leptothoe sp. LEGE 181152]NEZ57907.1 hypothetical protein [Adonisia turfae CCMR0081]NEZ62557.1 hypothetical protein [Adonisia turfae CCMR0082]
MEAFSPDPPKWAESATHALTFSCPHCSESASVATDVWINRRSPVYTHNHKRKWQEFYQCKCGVAWWAWSSDRPPNSWQVNDPPNDPPEESPSNLDPLTGLGDSWGSFDP